MAEWVVVGAVDDVVVTRVDDVASVVGSRVFVVGCAGLPKVALRVLFPNSGVGLTVGSGLAVRGADEVLFLFKNGKGSSPRPVSSAAAVESSVPLNAVAVAFVPVLFVVDRGV